MINLSNWIVEYTNMLATYPHSWVCYFVNFALIKCESRLAFKFRVTQVLPDDYWVTPYFNICQWFTKLSVESVELSTFGCKRKKGSETHKAYLIWVIPPLEFQYMVLHLILQANLHHSSFANLFITLYMFWVFSSLYICLWFHKTVFALIFWADHPWVNTYLA